MGAADVLFCPNASRCDIFRGVGAESVVLVGREGSVGVDGGSEVDGGGVLGWRSSARTTSAGVPLGEWLTQ